MKKFKITGRNLPSQLSTAATVMTVISLDRMIGEENRAILDVTIRFKHHDAEGEAIRKSKNRYEVIVDHHRITHDAWNREYGPDERTVKIVNIVAHEMTHVAQYYRGTLVKKSDLLYHHGVNHAVDDLQTYFDAPYEEEARGKEEGHMIAFLHTWKKLIDDGVIEL